MLQPNLKALFAKVSPEVKALLERAANLALGRTHHEVDLEHLLLAGLEMPQLALVQALRHVDLDLNRLEADLNRALDNMSRGNQRNPVLSVRVPQALQAAWLLASVEWNASVIDSGHLLLALLEDDLLAQCLRGSSRVLQDVPMAELRAYVQAISPQATGGVAPSATPTSGVVAPATQKALAQYTLNLTARALAGQLDPVLGRDGEIRQMMDILLRRRQNNPILTGEAGVGKTAVVEGLALRIAAGEVPEALQGVQLHVLDLGLLQAGASVKGEFEQRLRGVIDEVKASAQPIILFIDEAHTLIGAGGQAGQNDAANLLKPALARGELRTIAATTWAEYKKYFEKDAALARRFQVVKVEEPADDQAVHMLRGVAQAMEAHHGVRILDAAVQDAVRLSSRYLVGRQLPDKAISVLDTACARVALSQAAQPEALEKLQRRIEDIDRESTALAREQLGRELHAERLRDLRLEREALAEGLSGHQAAHAAQQTLVDRIALLRAELAEQLAGNGEGTARTSGLLSDLESAEAELAQLHEDSSLVHACVNSQLIAEVISGWTGIPLGNMITDEIDTVRQLASRLQARIIGQDHALQRIAERVQIAWANLDDPVKPRGVFMLVGPSGVGKTETALALADLLYGGERNLITINLSEYQEAHSVSGLKGSPPGYVGYGEGGVLTEAVRRKPYSVVLLDEVEKAHPDVLELFFQVFDKGFMEDAEGREIDFRNTIILLTSNAGTETLMRAVRHGVRDVDAPAETPNRRPSPDELAQLLQPELQRVFKPAFLGRLTVVPYYPVEDDVLAAIIRLKLERIRRRVASNHQAEFSYDPALVELILDRCTEVDSGARAADTILNQTILSDLSREVLTRMASGEPIRRMAVQVDEQGGLRYALEG